MDAVVLWLDTTDKNYIRQRNKDFGKQKPWDHNRIGHRDELRFCLRGLYYNMSWLRKIYLVTWDSQFPDWLDEDACLKLSPPIIKIKRETLNDGNFLYGSDAVEACIYKIPDLSELFIYANCDTFVCKPMKQSEWIDRNGIGLMFGTHTIQYSKPFASYYMNYFYMTQIGLFLDAFGKPNFPFFQNSHQVSLLSKQAYKDARIAYPDLYEKTVNLRGRETTEYITRNLIEYIAIHKGYIKLSKKKIPHEYFDVECDFKNYELKKNTVLFCTNLNSFLKENHYVDYIMFMIELFPKPLPSETHLKYETTCFYSYTRKHKHCKNKLVVKTDSICYLPDEDTFDITHRIPGLRKTQRRRRLDRCRDS
jgi:hypothetical protein